MKFEIDQSIEVLERTPNALRALLGGLSDGWVLSNYGPDTLAPSTSSAISSTPIKPTG
jgi:hypothetical protein